MQQYNIKNSRRYIRYLSLCETLFARRRKEDIRNSGDLSHTYHSSGEPPSLHFMSLYGSSSVMFAAYGLYRCECIRRGPFNAFAPSVTARQPRSFLSS